MKEKSVALTRIIVTDTCGNEFLVTMKDDITDEFDSMKLLSNIDDAVQKISDNESASVSEVEIKIKIKRN